MPIKGEGWEILVERLGIHVFHARSRTYATYQVFIEGKPVDELGGHICECVGPGNLVKSSGKRILQGRYPLSTQFGTRYKTVDYETKSKIAGKIPMPGILFAKETTKPRDGILIHPGHPPKLYLSSIGCLNPTKPLRANDVMDFWESRERVIALIDSLHGFATAAFKPKSNTTIPNARAVVDGEPMNVLPDAPPKPIAPLIS
jgi:hypothetical protein